MLLKTSNIYLKKKECNFNTTFRPSTFLVFLFLGCGIAGIAAVYVNSPIIGTYMFIILLCCGLANTVVSAATVELYPTNLRAMAICISLMMGRMGSVVGTNVVAYLLDDHCESVFILSGSSLLGEYSKFQFPFKLFV